MTIKELCDNNIYCDGCSFHKVCPFFNYEVRPLNTIDDDFNYAITDAIIETAKMLAPSKTGHWIDHYHEGIHHIECSECSTWFLRSNLVRNSFCPNCGAKMGSEVNNG